MFPDELEVTVTARQLDGGSRTDRGAGPLALAVAVALKEAGIVTSAVLVRDEDVVIYVPGRKHHIARYWLGDKAWKIAARHKAGRRVKPGTVTLTVIYADRIKT